jgi:hypothetical protein
VVACTSASTSVPDTTTTTARAAQTPPTVRPQDPHVAATVGRNDRAGSNASNDTASTASTVHVGPCHRRRDSRITPAQRISLARGPALVRAQGTTCAAVDGPRPGGPAGGQ